MQQAFLVRVCRAFGLVPLDNNSDFNACTLRETERSLPAEFPQVWRCLVSWFRDQTIRGQLILQRLADTVYRFRSNRLVIAERPG